MRDYGAPQFLKWLGIPLIAGAIGACVAFVFKSGLGLVAGWVDFSVYWLFPVGGGIIASAINYWDLHAAGSGTDHFIAAIRRNHGELPLKTGFSKLFSTIATLGFGGSGGTEGPSLLIGAAWGSALQSIPIVSKIIGKDRRLAAVCGAAGMLGAVFGTPIGAGIFVAEVIEQSSLHYATLFPAIFSSLVGSSIYAKFHPGSPGLISIPVSCAHAGSALWFVLAGLTSGLLSLIFIFIYKQSTKRFQQIHPRWLRPIVGGALTGLIILVYPQVSGPGLDFLQALILGQPLSLVLAFAFILAKILATSATVGSGQSAGLVIPSLFLGALGGVVVFKVFHVIHPELGIPLIVAGMGGALAGIANVPIAATIILIEMGGVHLAIPAAVGSIVGYVLTHTKRIYILGP